MSDKPIAQKLLIKPGYKVLILDAPEGYLQASLDLPAGVTMLKGATGPADVIQLFVHNRAELEARLPELQGLLGPKTVLWITYPKGTSKSKADINRDTINAYAQSLGLVGVAMVSVDETWSALRVRAM